MTNERWTIHNYTPEAFERVRQTCLHVASVLGDWMERVTLIGGAVPSLLIPPDRLPEGVEPHPGTVDVDLGLELAVLDDEGYASIAKLLRAAGYRAEEKEEDRIRRQTWRTDPAFGPKVTIDFLIPRSSEMPRPARIQDLEADFAAIIADGLQLVERDRRKVVVSGQTLRGEQAERSIWVCGPASFTVLKARAIHLREKPKDAFDLHYILANEQAGISALAATLRLLLDDPDAIEALTFLESDYRQVDSVGPARAAYFVYGDPVAANQEDIDLLRASAHAHVQRLRAALR
ncbi:MAG: nucleotidyl transferase AbiEii/AbiGii toxin family protein [Fimbriimonadaceae bacterium]|nr:nucleotidyl transferase AbiEii/AbiGii toxin family protein [Fimbriimonadaceae bacterium]